MRILQATLCVAMIGALSACGEGGFQFPGGSTGADGQDGADASSASSVRLVETEVEDPLAFQVTDQGLWDGRPSLGGVWVAHPDASDPERVIIRNDDTGDFVIGALFRRERENPGPVLQVSSDAAAALGMIAGQPARLNVTALRREETPAAASPESIGAIAQAIVGDAPPPADSQPGPAATVPGAAPAPAASTDSALDRPFIQIGIFSVEANAERAADMLRSAGMVPAIRVGSSQGSSFWRVVVGPARNGAERDQLLAQVRELGFADAYAVLQ